MDTNFEPSSADPALAIQAIIENNENITFIFDLLTDVDKMIKRKPPTDGENFLSLSQYQTLVDRHISIKNPTFSNHSRRLTHFILYLNTKVDGADWVKENYAFSLDQNLIRYIHGSSPLSIDTYFKLMEVLSLRPFIAETIMCTPYSFCHDLIDIIFTQIKRMDNNNNFERVIATENLLIPWLKSIKRQPVKPSLEDDLLSKFNEAMLLFVKDSDVPTDLQKIDSEEEKKKLIKYNGYRVMTIFKIFIELIKFINDPGKYKQYPMYSLKPIRSSDSDPPTDNGNILFQKLMTIVKQKCVELCQFDIDTWLSWYEIEVVDEDTNLQACIGFLIYQLCNFIEEGIVDDPYLKNILPILKHMSIEKLDLSNVDITKIEGLVENVESCSNSHINDWIKKMIENTKVYSHSQALSALDKRIKNIDYNCLRCLIDSIMNYFKQGGVVSEPLINVMRKGITNLDNEDKINILKHFMVNYADVDLFALNDFDKLLGYIVRNEFSALVDKKDLMSKLIWLAMLQPRKVLHKLVSLFVTGLYGVPVKTIDTKRGFVHQVTVIMHLHMAPMYVYEEYGSWLDIDKNLSEKDMKTYLKWSIQASRTLQLMKPKHFLINVLIPLLTPSQNHAHMLFIVNLTKNILKESNLIALTDIDQWDDFIIKLAFILEDARWDIENYSRVRVELCDSIIAIVQPLLQYAVYLVKPSEVDNVKDALSKCHLLTIAHFLRIWGEEYIVIEGMDEQFIMTVQSLSHISYANLNQKSTQRSLEEFIFSIATYMPKFTLTEMKSFIANYLNTAKQTNIQEASYFLFDCVMNALMRIIVHMKIAHLDSFERAWDYVENTIDYFINALNTSKMSSMFNDNVEVEMALNTISQLFMVTKQIESSRQFKLLSIVRRLIDLIYNRLDVETITKLLVQIASIKTQNCKDTMGYTVEILVRTINAKKNPVPVEPVQV